MRSALIILVFAGGGGGGASSSGFNGGGFGGGGFSGFGGDDVSFKETKSNSGEDATQKINASLDNIHTTDHELKGIECDAFVAKEFGGAPPIVRSVRVSFESLQPSLPQIESNKDGKDKSSTRNARKRQKTKDAEMKTRKQTGDVTEKGASGKLSPSCKASEVALTDGHELVAEPDEQQSEKPAHTSSPSKEAVRVEKSSSQADETEKLAPKNDAEQSFDKSGQQPIDGSAAQETPSLKVMLLLLLLIRVKPRSLQTGSEVPAKTSAGSKKTKQKAKNAERLACKQVGAAGDASEKGVSSAKYILCLMTQSYSPCTADDQLTASETFEQQVEVPTSVE